MLVARLGKSRDAILAVLCLSVLAGASCSEKTDLPKDYADTAKALDAVAANFEEFGTASMSAPVLAAPQDAFKFNLTKVDADQLYSDAKTNVQVRAAEFQQQAQITGIAARASFDPTMAAAYAAQLSQYQQAVAQNNQAIVLMDLKNRLINSAAIDQYRSALAAAQKETDPKKKAAELSDAMQALNNGMVGATPTTLPSFPTAQQPATAPTNLAQNASDAAALFSDSKFAGPLGLLAGQSAPVLDDGSALDIAAANNAKLAIYKALGDPTLVTKFADKKVLLGVVTVAVNPGWRTHKNYAVDIAMTVQWGDFVPARLEVVKNFVSDARFDLAIRKRIAMSYGLDLPSGMADPFPLDRPIPASYSTETPEGEHPGPAVAAVSPMSKSLVEADQNSRRQQIQIALDLAASFMTAGLTAQGSFFQHYADSLQKDLEAIQADVVINTYNFNGGLFGFQVGPNLRVLDATANGYSQAADVLTRQSFPALILIGLEDDEVRPRVQRNAAGDFVLMERKLLMHSLTRWLPLKGSNWWSDDGKRLTEQAQIELMHNLQVAGAEFLGTCPSVRKTRDLLLTVIAQVEDLEELQRKNEAAAGSKPEGAPPTKAPDLDELITLRHELDTVIRDLPPEAPNDEKIEVFRHKLAQINAIASVPEAMRDTAALYLAESRDQRKQLKKLQTKQSQAIKDWQTAGRDPKKKPADITDKVEAFCTRVAELKGAAAQLKQSETHLRESRNALITDVLGDAGATRATLEKTKEFLDKKLEQAAATSTAPGPTACHTQGELAVRQSITHRATTLQFFTFDAYYDTPIPVSYLAAPPAAKHPSVTQVAGDFTPTLQKLVPKPTDAVEIDLFGKDLTAVDLTGVKALDGTGGTLLTDADNKPSITADGIIHLKVNVTDVKQPIAFSLPVAGGTDVIYSLPYMIPHIEEWDPKHPAIRRITGSLADPTQQKLDETEYTPDVNERIVHSVHEADKPPPTHSETVHVKIESDGDGEQRGPQTQRSQSN